MTFAVLWAHLISSPSMVVMLAGIAFVHGRLQLSTTLTYPLSRARRARPAVAGAAVEAATITILVALVAFAVHVLGVPVLPWFVEDVQPVGWVPVVAMLWAWAPVAQWPAIRWPAPAGQSRDGLAWRFLPWGAYGVAGALAARGHTGRGWLALALATVGIAATLQAAIWWAAHRHYARGDLDPRVPGGARG